MKIQLRLEEVLQAYKAADRGHITNMAAATQLERHKISALLNNEAKHISLTSLGAICDYLIRKHGLKAEELLGRLFGIEPEDFVAMIADRDYVEVCVGMWTEPPGIEAALRAAARRTAAEAGEDAGCAKAPVAGRRHWVMASDSLLLGALLHELGSPVLNKHPQTVEQKLVSASGSGLDPERAKAEARSVFTAFQTRGGDCVRVCLGSVKSNVAIECVVASLFSATPFVAEDDVTLPRMRHCPFYLRFRSEPVLKSCHGGLRLARGKKTTAPGIYYETKSGDWECIPSTDTRDAALVFYHRRVAAGKLEVLMGGFSGRATQCLATALRSLTPQFWPPCYERSDLQVGAFLVDFRFNPPARQSSDNEDRQWMYQPSQTNVIPLDRKVLERRL